MKPRCSCAGGGLVHIDMGGPDRRITDAGGRVWLFEDHPNFGPVIIRRDGHPTAIQPGSRSPFWPAWEAWRDAGRPLEADGTTCSPSTE